MRTRLLTAISLAVCALCAWTACDTKAELPTELPKYPVKAPIAVAKATSGEATVNGVVDDDKRTITFDAKKNNYELHKDIRSIKLGIGGDCPTVQVNEQFAVRFSMLGSGYKGTGAGAALICLYAFKQNPDLKQISLVM